MNNRTYNYSVHPQVFIEKLRDKYKIRESPERSQQPVYIRQDLKNIKNKYNDSTHYYQRSQSRLKLRQRVNLTLLDDEAIDRRLHELRASEINNRHKLNNNATKDLTREDHKKLSVSPIKTTPTFKQFKTIKNPEKQEVKRNDLKREIEKLFHDSTAFRHVRPIPPLFPEEDYVKKHEYIVNKQPQQPTLSRNQYMNSTYYKSDLEQKKRELDSRVSHIKSMYQPQRKLDRNKYLRNQVSPPPKKQK